MEIKKTINGRKVKLVSEIWTDADLACVGCVLFNDGCQHTGSECIEEDDKTYCEKRHYWVDDQPINNQ